MRESVCSCTPVGKSRLAFRPPLPLTPILDTRVRRKRNLHLGSANAGGLCKGRLQILLCSCHGVGSPPGIALLIFKTASLKNVNSHSIRTVRIQVETVPDEKWNWIQIYGRVSCHCNLSDDCFVGEGDSFMFYQQTSLTSSIIYNILQVILIFMLWFQHFRAVQPVQKALR